MEHCSFVEREGGDLRREEVCTPCVRRLSCIGGKGEGLGFDALADALKVVPRHTHTASAFGRMCFDPRRRGFDSISLDALQGFPLIRLKKAAREIP
jgi:hypothetical protein